MIGEPMDKAAERAWKHRYAQTLYEFFSLSGLGRAAALDDAYAHADAQYSVRNEQSPEDQAQTATLGIDTNLAQTAANSSAADAPGTNPYNGVYHLSIVRTDPPEPHKDAAQS